MKESVLDVLMYLFENYMDEDLETEPDRSVLKTELSQAGFTCQEVDRAFSWLEDLAIHHPNSLSQLSANRSVRVFCDAEIERLDTDCRGYLLHLEQIGILTPSQRELCIDRLMALDCYELDIDQIKWVVLMVLFNQPGQEDAYARMEDLVFEDKADAIH